MQKKLFIFTIFLILVTLGLFVSAVYDYAIIKKTHKGTQWKLTNRIHQNT